MKTLATLSHGQNCLRPRELVSIAKTSHGFRTVHVLMMSQMTLTRHDSNQDTGAAWA